MLIFNNNKPIKQKRWINTKVEFIWDGSQYVEQSAEGYWYDGEMALCVHWGEITSGTVDDYNLIFQPNEGNYAGIQFTNEAGNGAGFLLVRANEDSGNVYKADGLTLVADSGLLTLATRGGNDDLRLMTGADGAGVTRMTIKGTSGNVGIGTASPSHTLDVSASTSETYSRIKNTSSSGQAILILNNDVGNWQVKCDTDDTFKIRDNGNTSNRLTIDAAGEVGIGTDSPSYKLEVAGTFYSAGSSIDYKKHVTDLDVDSSLIHSLRPVSYNYKKEYKDFGYNVKEGKQIGLVSEEVAETIPELAIMKDGRPKNVDYQKLAVVLLAEVQSLKKDIEELKKDN